MIPWPGGWQAVSVPLRLILVLALAAWGTPAAQAICGELPAGDPAVEGSWCLGDCPPERSGGSTTREEVQAIAALDASALDPLWWQFWRWFEKKPVPEGETATEPLALALCQLPSAVRFFYTRPAPPEGEGEPVSPWKSNRLVWLGEETPVKSRDLLSIRILHAPQSAFLMKPGDPPPRSAQAQAASRGCGGVQILEKWIGGLPGA